MNVRETWRLALLLFLILGSGVALFGPGIGTGESNLVSDGTQTTNLAYGIELDGGTRLRAPVAGWTAEGVGAGADNASVAVAESLGLEPIDAASVDTDGDGVGDTVEVRARNLTRSQVASALADAGVDVDSEAVSLRSGVTAQTRQEMVDVIDRKIRESALSGGSVKVATTLDGEHYIEVEAPDRGEQELRDLLRERGVVTIDAYYPENGTYTNSTVIRRDDISDIGQPQRQRGSDLVAVPLTIRDSRAREVAEAMVAAGFVPGNADTRTATGEQYISCGGPGNESGRCLLVVSDDEVVNHFGMFASLASSFQNGDFERNPTFQMQVNTMDEAQSLAINLRAGALPAPLDYSEDALNVYTVDPALAEQFRTNSLLTGLFAVIAVSLVVYGRYRDARVAVPMVLTALSEVVLLLGFAAVAGYPLNFSVIAGFIAVIGTGVDDLVIIADEVMSEGDVSSSKVFQSRFRKALWVIGAAAATTIIAMSPLAFLSLGDLQGFAIVTILGVILGVLVTRPAYGDILRTLLTDR